MWKRLYVKYLLFSSDFNETLIFLTDFRKSLNIKFYQICPVGAELFHADGHRQTDRQTDGRTNGNDEVNNHFSQFCERAKNQA